MNKDLIRHLNGIFLSINRIDVLTGNLDSQDFFSGWWLNLPSGKPVLVLLTEEILPENVSNPVNNGGIYHNWLAGFRKNPRNGNSADSLGDPPIPKTPTNNPFFWGIFFRGCSLGRHLLPRTWWPSHPFRKPVEFQLDGHVFPKIYHLKNGWKFHQTSIKPMVGNGVPGDGFEAK